MFGTAGWMSQSIAGWPKMLLPGLRLLCARVRDRHVSLPLSSLPPSHKAVCVVWQWVVEARCIQQKVHGQTMLKSVAQETSFSYQFHFAQIDARNNLATKFPAAKVLFCFPA